MDALLGIQLLQSFTRKRKFNEEIDELEDIFKINYQKTDEVVPLIAQAAIGTRTGESKKIREMLINSIRKKKYFGAMVTNAETDEEFKDSIYISRTPFKFILDRINPYARKKPTCIVPSPIQTHKQHGLTIYRMAHRCSFKMIKICLEYCSLLKQRHSTESSR